MEVVLGIALLLSLSDERWSVLVGVVGSDSESEKVSTRRTDVSVLRTLSGMELMVLSILFHRSIKFQNPKSNCIWTVVQQEMNSTMM